MKEWGEMKLIENEEKTFMMSLIEDLNVLRTTINEDIETTICIWKASILVGNGKSLRSQRNQDAG